MTRARVPQATASRRAGPARALAAGPAVDPRGRRRRALVWLAPTVVAAALLLFRLS